MTSLRNWETIPSTVKEFTFSPAVETAVRWLERHPRTVLAGAAVLMMAMLLSQAPEKPQAEADACNDETPLFV